MRHKRQYQHKLSRWINVEKAFLRKEILNQLKELEDHGKRYQN